jgi:hypothetical protein
MGSGNANVGRKVGVKFKIDKPLSSKGYPSNNMPLPYGFIKESNPQEYKSKTEQVIDILLDKGKVTHDDFKRLKIKKYGSVMWGVRDKGYEVAKVNNEYILIGE